MMILPEPELLPHTPKVVEQLEFVTLMVTFDVLRDVDKRLAVNCVMVMSDGSISHIPPRPALIEDSKFSV